MRKKVFLAVICFLLLGSSKACLNIFAIDSAGNPHYLEHYFFIDIRFNQDAVYKNLKTLQRQFKKGRYDYKNISDYGAYLLMAGRFEEGLQLFKALAAKKGDVYQIRANLAVAYELNGMIDSALYWQQLAVAANPAAHGGSEWIHLRILEARNAMQADSNWCLTHNVTGIQDSIALHYVNHQHEMEEGFIFREFLLQLEDRLPFTFANDPVMGKLLFELGEAYKAASIYRAYYCYALAKHLYPALAITCSAKMEAIRVKYPVTERGKNEAVENLMDAERERFPPDAAGASRFIKEITERPVLKKFTINTMPISVLIQKIQ
jgi:hypothetical protein